MSSKSVIRSLSKASLSKLAFSRASVFNLTNRGLIPLTQIPQSTPSLPSLATRQFSSSFTAYKKGGGKEKKQDKRQEKKSVQTEEESADLSEIIDEMNTKMDKLISEFIEKAQVIRKGKYTPDVLGEIIVSTAAHSEEPLKNIARVTLQGPRKITITTFDSNNNKHVIAAILAADLNLNPQPDDKQEQVLNIPLPPFTRKLGDDIIKNIKDEYEQWRNRKNKSSLALAREDAKKSLKKAKASKDEDKLYKEKIDEAFKTQSAKLLKHADAIISSIKGEMDKAAR